MRRCDIYKIREYGYFKKFGVCKHAKECKKLRPEDFSSCPGFDDEICEPMRKYYLLGKSPAKLHNKNRRFIFAYIIFGVLSSIGYILAICKYGFAGLVFATEPWLCVMLTLWSHNSAYNMTINKNDRKAARKFMWILICCFVVGIICAFVQIQHWVYNNANPILFTITTLIMLFPIACILMYLDIEMKKCGFKL